MIKINSFVRFVINDSTWIGQNPSPFIQDFAVELGAWWQLPLIKDHFESKK
jgi:hypothetical protein